MGSTPGKYRISRLFLGILASLLALLPAGFHAAPAPAGVTLISCDRNGAVIEVKLPDLSDSTVTKDGRNFTLPSVFGWSHLAEAGKPCLPQAAVMMALPPGAHASLAVEVLGTRTVALPDPLPAPRLNVNLQGNQVDEIYRTDDPVYTSALLFPQAWASLGDPVWQRTYWAIPVRITPVRIQAGLGQAQVAQHLRLRLTFHGGRPGRYLSDPFGEPMARQSLLNFQQARSWQERPATATALTSQPYGRYKVYVNRDGLQVIRHADLVAAGISPDTLAQLNPQTFKLQVRTQTGQADTLAQVPMWVEGEWDGHFDPDDYILFFGNFARGRYTYENKYTHTNTYWLNWGGAPGLRITSRTAAPSDTAALATEFRTHTRVEKDSLYERFGFADAVGADTIDHWLWHRLDSQFAPSFTYLQYLPEHVPSPSPFYNYSLTTSVRGYTLDTVMVPDHHYTVTFNNHPAIDAWMDNQDPSVVTVSIPYDWMPSAPGAPAQITFQAPVVPGMSMANAYFVDWIRMDYWRSYHVLNDTLLFQRPQGMALGEMRYQLTGVQEQNPDSVELWNLTRGQKLTGFTLNEGTLAFQDSSLTDSTVYYLASRDRWVSPDSIVRDIPSDWKNPNQHYDYLMVTYDDFYDALAPLVSLYTSRGMTVARAKLSDLYDEFNFGMKDPQAIKDFIQYAYFNYQGNPPAYVALVGDASWDYKNYDTLSYVDYCPTHHFWTYKWGETASDNYFAAVSGNDIVPDCYIGRLPVNNADEINLMVEKSLSYAQAPTGYWRSQTIFSNGAIDIPSATIFDDSVSAWVSEFFPSWYNATRIYNLPSPGNEQYWGNEATLINAINQGAVMVNYQGHAGNQIWETLTLPGIASLTNGVKMPFVQSYSCFTGIFSNTRGFGESFILQPGGGAIAYFSNGAVGWMQTNADMNRYMMEQLFAPPDTTQPVTFGRAMTQSKVNFYAEYDTTYDVVTTFVLLGDPGSQFVYQYPDPADTLDNLRPEISVSFGPQPSGFRSGDFVTNPVQMTCSIFDSTSLDTSSLYLKLAQVANEQGQSTGDSLSWYWWWNNPLNNLPPGFAYSCPDTQHLNLTYNDSLSPGEWMFYVRISDMFNNGPAFDSVTFNISGEKLSLDQPLNYPNPFRDQTSFTFSLSTQAQVTIKIFTVAGRLVRNMTFTGDAGYNIHEWDGRDQQGDPLSNGVYIYKIIARDGDQQVEKIEKLAKLR